MSKVNDIRRMRREGKSVSAIARDVGVSRDTVYRYLRMDDVSPKMPAKATRGSRLDPWRPLIESWLDEDRRCWRKSKAVAPSRFRLVNVQGFSIMCQANKEEAHQLNDLAVKAKSKHSLGLFH